MEDIKTRFQQISTELESLLEQYKTCYPRNLGQMIRHNTGKILAFSMLIVFVPFVLSMSITAIIFALVAFPGLMMFAVLNMHMGNDEVAKEWKKTAIGIPILGDADDEGNFFRQIQSTKAQTAPLSQYPDVHNYLEGYDKRFYSAVDTKKKVRRQFKQFILYSLAVIIGLSIFFGARLGYKGVDDTVDDAMEYMCLDIPELLGAQKGQPLFTLKNMDSGSKAEFYYEDKYLKSKGLQKPSGEASMYIFTFTDKDGVPIPRSPRIRLEESDQEIYTEFVGEKIDFAVFKILEYVRDNQQDLRYKVEKINVQ